MADEAGKDRRQTRGELLKTVGKAFSLGVGLTLSKAVPVAGQAGETEGGPVSWAEGLSIEGFSDEEATILRGDLRRVASFVAEKYGQIVLRDMPEIVFKKVAPEAKMGHGQYTGALLKNKEDGRGTYTELQITELGREPLRELHHQLGHLFFTNFVVPGKDDGIEGREWTIRVSEGIAEAFTYLLEKDMDTDLFPADRVIEVYQSEYGSAYRHDTALSQVKFNYTPAAYQTAAAATLVLEDRFPGWFGTLARAYKQRYDAKDYSLSTADMLGKIEEVHPGFKQALEQEPALLFRQQE